MHQGVKPVDPVEVNISTQMAKLSTNAFIRKVWSGTLPCLLVLVHILFLFFYMPFVGAVQRINNGSISITLIYTLLTRIKSVIGY